MYFLQVPFYWQKQMKRVTDGKKGKEKLLINTEQSTICKRANHNVNKIISF